MKKIDSDQVDYEDYVALWAKRSQVLEEMSVYDLRKKDLLQRLKSIAYFNGISASTKSDHLSSGLLEYTKFTDKLKTH